MKRKINEIKNLIFGFRTALKKERYRPLNFPRRKEYADSHADANSCLQVDIKVGYAYAAGKYSTCRYTERGEIVEDICGDTVTTCNLADNKKALIISDGMGMGMRASISSKRTVARLRSNLKSGMSISKAIKEVNHHIINLERDFQDKSEDFATIDLTIIDRASGQAKFYKMGATWSFIVRGKSVRKIQQPALPIGIVPKLKLTHISTNLSQGDMIIMASDGVMEADRQDYEGTWLIRYLSSIGKDVKSGKERRPRVIASQILYLAQEINFRYEADDMTVLVAIIV